MSNIPLPSLKTDSKTAVGFHLPISKLIDKCECLLAYCREQTTTVPMSTSAFFIQTSIWSFVNYCTASLNLVMDRMSIMRNYRHHV